MNQTKQSNDGFHGTLADCTNPIRIAKQIHKNGARRYKGFDSFDVVTSFVRKNRNESLHEVTRCGDGGIQRLFLDIDAKTKDFDYPIETIEKACDLLMQSTCKIIESNKITDCTYIEMVSHRPDKFSKHTVFSNAYIDSNHYKCFYNTLSSDFALNLMANDLPTDLTKIIDKDVYNKHHCLRLHTSFKYGSDVRLKKRDPNTGLIEEDGEFDVETMVTYIPKNQSKIQIYKCPEGCTGPEKPNYHVDATDDHLKIAGKILDSMSDYGISVARLDRPFIRLNIDHSKPCYVCKNKHDSENLMAVVNSEHLRLICRRKEKNDPNRSVILYSFGKYIEDVPILIEEIKSMKVIKTRSNYLSPLDEILDICDRLFIKSGMGSAKSTRVHEYIARMLKLNPNFRCVFLTYRVNLAANIKAAAKKANPDLKDPFEKYNDIFQHKISLSNYGRLIIQLESLNRLEYDLDDSESIDLLVIDEAVSFCQQSDSGLNKIVNTRNQMMLRNVIRNSKKTIIMDALLDTPTIEAYQYLLPNDNQTLWINDPVDHWAPHLEEFKCSVKCRKQLAESVKAGKKIYVSMTNGECAVKQLERYLLKHKDGLKILTIYGGGENNEFIISNINEELLKYDVVIASPCMSAGISFDVKDHFDEVYAFIDNRGPTAIDIIQSLRRVRHTKNNKIVFCDMSYKIQLPTSYKDIFNEEQSRLKFNSKEYIKAGFSVEIDRNESYFANPESPGLKWRIGCKRIANLNSIDKFGVTKKYLISQGATVVKVVNKEEDEEIKKERKEFKNDGIEVKKDINVRIANTPVITEDEYEPLRSGGKRFAAVDHDIQQPRKEKDADLMRKFQLLRHYGLHEDLFVEDNKQVRIAPFNNPEFVEIYSRDEVKECYREMIYRNLTEEQVKEIDDKVTGAIEETQANLPENQRKSDVKMCDEDIMQHHFLFGRHVTITRIRNLFVSNAADYEPVVSYVKEHHAAKNPLLRGYKEISKSNIVTALNKLMSPYGYRVHRKIIGGRNNRKQFLELEDYACTLFAIKIIPFNSDDLTISRVRQSGTSEMPVAVIYEK